MCSRLALCACAAMASACGDTADSASADATGSTTTGTTATTKVDDPLTGTDTTSTTVTTGTGSTGEVPFMCPLREEAFPDHWVSGGPDCGDEPAIQVHAYDEHTVILRQSLCTSFEAPFIYLLFGEDRVLMEDSGDGGIPIADTVASVIADWLAANGKDSIELVLINSHAHGDHVRGNDEIAAIGATVVGVGVSAVSTFFDIEWPAHNGAIDLGGRVVDVIPIPGHEASHVALYDEQAGLLLTGDTLYPGRLYIADFPTYVTSVTKLADIVADRELCWVLGTHIEMTNTAGVDFDFGATHHPDEHPLALEGAHLVELADAVVAMGDTPIQEVHDDFIVFPL